ncbi:MAG: 4-hydroxy-tetrahydrodipicolinate reductase [Promethearchaeota archaeon]|nr:MAG: 4-hydroxy-tetrahydrodipicolinate reductase [Candidatus Lokiarchaeota archaeon]
MIKLLILGASGSMGKLISKLALEDKDIEVVAACDIINTSKKLGQLVGAYDPNEIVIEKIDNLAQIIDESSPEVAVDFSIAEATEKNCMLCAEKALPCVIGTTGLSEEFLTRFEETIKNKEIPAVISSNMATGVNILFKMTSVLTEFVSDWDIEVIEAHHHRKVDAPSGTALTLAKIISEALNVDLDEVGKFGRSKGPNKRKIGAKNEIGIHSIRAGDIVGDHTILYAGPGERIELKHQAHSRDCFASGAIKAVKFLAQAKESRIYTTAEVLGL